VSGQVVPHIYFDMDPAVWS